MPQLSPYDGMSAMGRSSGCGGGPASRAALAALMLAAAHPLAVPLAVAGAVLVVGYRLYPVLGVPAAWVLVALANGRAQPSIGVLLRPRHHPELFGLLGEVARRIGFRWPLVVRLVPVPVAGVVAVRVQGRRRSVLILGWPYLRQLTARQLAAVLAHELAHELAPEEEHGDDPTVRWLLVARTALVDSLDRTVHLPRALVDPLLARTRRDAFAVELAADSAAAAVVGTDACRDALHAGDRLAAVFEAFAERYLPRLVEDGEYPTDLYAAYADALADPLVLEAAQREVDLVDAAPDDPALTHPVTARRVGALPQTTVDRPPGDPDRPVPVVGVDELDRRCVEELIDVADLAPVRLLDRDPEWFTVPLDEARSALAAASQAVVGRDGLDAAFDAISSGAWRDVAARLEPVPDHVPEPAVPLLLRATYAGCLTAVLSGLLLRAGHGRVSRWSLSRLRAPGGDAVDVRGLVDRALAEADPAPLRALLMTTTGPTAAAS